MNWKGIFAFGIVAGLSGLLTIYGVIPARAGYAVMLIIGLAVAYWVGNFTTGRPFLHGFWVGVVYGLVAGLIGILLFDTMLANNPQMAEQMKQAKEAFSGDFDRFTRIAMWIGLPFQMVVDGLIMGVFGWVGWMIFGGKKPAEEMTAIEPVPPPPPSPEPTPPSTEPQTTEQSEEQKEL